MVCGKQLHYVNNTHLRGHRLTIQQYKIRFSAEIFTKEFLYRRKKSCQDRVFQRACPRCGSAFTTGNPKTFYCGHCQPIMSVEKRRRYQQRYRRMRKRTIGREPFRILGTFSKHHLSIHNGRVLAAVLLEKGISINARKGHNSGKVLECEDCGTSVIIDVIDHEAYCAECGCKIVVARENEYYSIQAEPVCVHCGLVYVDIPQIPFFSVRGETPERKRTPCRLKITRRNQKHVPCDQAGRGLN